MELVHGGSRFTKQIYNIYLYIHIIMHDVFNDILYICYDIYI